MADTADQLLVERIRDGEGDAWTQLIARYEGRLLAFAQSRLNDSAAAEDVVQETFIGFLSSLPHYDARRSLESYLFSIAAHKLTDYLRRKGRRPELPLTPPGDTGSADRLPGSARHPSSIARGREQADLEQQALADALATLVQDWIDTGQFERLKCLELLVVRGWANKDVAARLGIGQQAVANHKFAALGQLRALLRQRNLSPEYFPELQEES